MLAARLGSLPKNPAVSSPVSPCSVAADEGRSDCPQSVLFEIRWIAVLSKLLLLTPRMRIILVSTLYLLLAQSAALAQNTPEELRKIARNPFADEIKLSFEEDVTFSLGPYDRTANSLQIKPEFPISITKDWLLVTRVIATALAYQPDSAAKRGGTTGLGDTTASFFLTPVHTGRLIWGLGPTVSIPSATSDQLGFGKWGLGTSFAALVQPEWGTAELLVQNIWSIAGGSNRSPVNQLQLEPTFSYNLPRGWYLTSQPTITANWAQPTSDRWLVPIGGGVGRTFNLGRRAIDSNLAAYWNAVRPPNQFSPKWQLSLQFTLLFPKSSKTPK